MGPQGPIFLGAYTRVELALQLGQAIRMSPFDVAAPISTSSGGTGWHAQLDLEFASDGAATRLCARRHRGPLQVQRPFYPEADGTCHVYILHPPGGVVGGDRLDVNVTLARNARVLITTPAAGKIYRSERPIAHLAQRLHVAPGAVLEWLPQETIYFSGAQAHSHTRVDLAADAGFIGWEIACLGRPAAQEQFAAGAVRAGLGLWRDGVPLYIERAHFHGGDSALMARWALDGCSVTGTLLAIARDAELVRALRTELATFPAPDRFAVTQADDVLVVRYLGHSAQTARQGFARAWCAIRAQRYGRAAHLPRVWA